MSIDFVKIGKNQQDCGDLRTFFVRILAAHAPTEAHYKILADKPRQKCIFLEQTSVLGYEGQFQFCKDFFS